MTIDPIVPTRTSLSLSAHESSSVEGSSLSDMDGLEVMGSVPLWVLCGLRLKRTGWRSLDSGWTVGLYRMDTDEASGIDSAFFEA